MVMLIGTPDSSFPLTLRAYLCIISRIRRSIARVSVPLNCCRRDETMGIVKRVYGRDRQHSTCYLTRVKLTPQTRWGQLYFHWFHRGDLDRDFHDHPYDFWTFPLRTYHERVLDLTTGEDRWNVVRRFRWHFRPAEYTHIQLGASRYCQVAITLNSERVPFKNNLGGPTVTFVWRKPTRRPWGFQVVMEINDDGSNRYRWAPWRDYLFP